MPNLIYECEYDADLELSDIGQVPYGRRFWAAITGGRLQGDRLNGKVRPVGGDWLIATDDGFGHVDVRAQFETADQALIHVYFTGLAEIGPKVASTLFEGGDGTEFGEHYFFVAMRMETGSESYNWVNAKQFLGQGRVTSGPGVSYRIFRVENDDE